MIFGPKPRDFELKMNRKERRLALRTAFQGRVDDMVVVENFADQLTAPKTKEVLSAMDRWGIDSEQKVLMITAEKNEVIYRSVRNVANIKLILATNLNAYDLVLADRLVVTAAALEKIQEVYSA